VQFLTPGGDPQRSIGAAWTPDGRHMLPLDAHVVLAVRAAGVPHVIAGTGPELRDLEEIRRIAERARLAGADGAWVMHPTHIPVVHEVFGYAEADLADARELVFAFAQALEQGVAIFDHHGQLADTTHARSALEMLRRARQEGVDVGELPDLDVGVPSADH
jgi:citrate lyase subunit beta/citryl-CoA lyase